MFTCFRCAENNDGGGGGVIIEDRVLRESYDNVVLKSSPAGFCLPVRMPWLAGELGVEDIEDWKAGLPVVGGPDGREVQDEVFEEEDSDSDDSEDDLFVATGGGGETEAKKNEDEDEVDKNNSDEDDSSSFESLSR